MAVLTKNSTEFAALSGTRNDSTTSLHCVSSVSIAIITNMRPPPKAKPQDSYIRGHGISPSTSDNGDLRGISFSDIPGKFKDLPVKDSVADILEPFAQTIFGTSSKIPRSTPFEFQSSQSDISFDLGGSNHSVKESKHQAVPVLSRPIVEKSFVLNKRKSNLSKIPLPQSAATFYNAFSPQFEIMESCESTVRLNLYLKARKDDVSAGIPGKFLHAVSDVGSIASTIMYALYLNETIKSDQLFFSCILPSYCFCTGLLMLFPNCRELAGILMDTGCLTSPHCTTKDNYMARIQYEISVLMNDQINKDFHDVEEFNLKSEAEVTRSQISY
uniref:Uncharacterized protein n=1 Tax=Salix viminalis TaxID=40686 RepID=A0A6N2K6S6_SALVM